MKVRQSDRPHDPCPQRKRMMTVSAECRLNGRPSTRLAWRHAPGACAKLMIFAQSSGPKRINGLACAEDTCEMGAHFHAHLRLRPRLNRRSDPRCPDRPTEGCRSREDLSREGQRGSWRPSRRRTEGPEFLK